MGRPRADPDRPKTCNRCKRSLPRTGDFFAANPDRHDGLMDACRECRARLKAQAERRDEEEIHPERMPAIKAEIEERLAIVRAAKRAKLLSRTRGEIAPGQSPECLSVRELNAILPFGRIAKRP